jgi:hypothetical protein
MRKRSYRSRTHHVHSHSSDSPNSGKGLFLPLTWSRKMSGTISRRGKMIHLALRSVPCVEEMKNGQAHTAFSRNLPMPRRPREKMGQPRPLMTSFFSHSFLCRYRFFYPVSYCPLVVQTTTRESIHDR